MAGYSTHKSKEDNPRARKQWEKYEHSVFPRCLFQFINEANNPVSITQLCSAGEGPQNTVQALRQ